MGLLLAVIVLAFPMTWWLKTALVTALVCVSIHLIFSSSLTIGFMTRSKVGMSLAAVAIIVSITWSPIHEEYLNDRGGNPDQPKQPTGNAIVAKLKNIPNVISGPATNERLQADTAILVKQLREFQKKVDDWNNTTKSTLNQDVKNEKSDIEAHTVFIEHTKELSASMAGLDKQFNSELKPQIIDIKNRLVSRLPPGSVPDKPTVEWTLKYGFSTFPNAVGHF
jgi:hypothetical protein